MKSSCHKELKVRCKNSLMSGRGSQVGHTTFIKIVDPFWGSRRWEEERELNVVVPGASKGGSPKG